MLLGCLIFAASGLPALRFTLTDRADNIWFNALVIWLLSVGGNEVIHGRYLNLTWMTEKKERPYPVALGDVIARLVGMVLVAIRELVAHLHDTVTPIFALAALNLAAMTHTMGLSATTAQKKHWPSLRTHLFLIHPAAYTVPRNINPKGTI